MATALATALKTTAVAAQVFLDRVSSSPLPTALGNLRAPSGGTCPIYGTETFLGPVEYSSHCQLIEEKRDLITLIAKTLWALLAAFILLG